MPHTPIKVAPKKKPRQARSRDTVDAIVQASAYILTKHGYDGFTTNRVAERAGVNIASLYQYFPNKDALLLEVLRRHSEETRAIALKILVAHRGSSLEAAVRTLVEAGIAAHTAHPRLHRVLAIEAHRLGKAVGNRDVDAELMDAWRAMLDDAIPRRKNLDLAIWIAMTSAHAVIHEAIIEHPEKAASAELVDELTEMVTRFLESKGKR